MKRFLTVLVLSLLALTILGTVVKAESGVRYNTFTSSNGRYVRTQTAYIALSENDIILGESLNTPNDIFIDEDNYVYIASTDTVAGTGKIIKFNLASDEIEIIGGDFLLNPTGIFVNEEGFIYVADKEAQIAYKLDASGNIVFEYSKPTSPLYGDDEFQPRKIVSDSRGNVYVLNNGSKGLMQYANDGSFYGYFGVNQIDPSFRTVLQYFFFTEEQRERLFSISPPEISNVAIDDRGLIHTTSLGDEANGVKRLNISGDNLLPEMLNDLDLVDIYVGPIGNIYVVSKSGWISEYDIEGNLLFTFGGQDVSNQIKGLFNIPSAIAVDDNYNIYVLDSANKELQIFIPTEFSDLVHTALKDYQDGNYETSMEPWQEVLKMNDLFDLAHSGLGNAYFSLGEYQLALNEYRISFDRDGYSDAYWEVRNIWLLANVETVLIIGLVLLVVYFVNMRVHFMSRLTDPIKKGFKNLRKKLKTLDEMLYVFRYLKNPADATYEIKRKNRVSMFSATILLVLYFLIYLIYIYKLGFLFNYRVIADINVVEEILKIFLPFGLWVISNSLVSSIREGEGRFKDVYITTVFSMTPIIIVLPIVTILSQVLTYNEEFIINMLTWVGLGTTIIYFFIMVKETHYYEVKATIGSIFISFFTMIMLLLSSIIIYILLNELFTLIKDIIMEVMARV
jgi:DNA-binding beta-propeller fold protein YncE